MEDKFMKGAVIVMVIVGVLSIYLAGLMTQSKGLNRCLSIYNDPWCCGLDESPTHDWAGNGCKQVNGMWTGVHECRSFEELNDSQRYACKGGEG